MRLRYAGTCRRCGAHLPPGARAVYERRTTSVRCLSHLDDEVESVAPPRAAPEPQPEPDPDPDPEPEPQFETRSESLAVESGTAGASARREYERRRAKAEARVRSEHPRLAGLILALGDERQSTKAWDTGAVGEERLGRGLDRLGSDTVNLLHDRRIPGSTANIDHLAVTASGIWVVDAKKYKGRPQLKVEGGILRPRVERLLVGRRDCTKLVDGVLKQVQVVRGVVGDEVPVRGVLCFVEADWPLIGGSFTTRDVQVVWPKKLYPQLQASGALTPESVADLHRQLARALPRA
nr:nuclease-related domain-containing protein [Pedococcus dokdonensis]